MIESYLSDSIAWKKNVQDEYIVTYLFEGEEMYNFANSNGIDATAEINLNIIGVIIFALSVSIDSFSVGLGINDITNNYYIASIIFALCSAAFTYLGIIIGKYSSKLIGKYAIILGIFLLLILGIFHLFI